MKPKRVKKQTAAVRMIAKAAAEPAAPQYLKDALWQNEKYLAKRRQRRKQFKYPTQMPMFLTEVAA